MPATKLKLKIADTVITLQSRFPLEELIEEEKRWLLPERFSNFFYTDNDNSHIFIDVRIVDKLPQPSQTRTLFITYHPDDKVENWRFSQKRNTYIYKTPLEGKEQIMFVNNTFDRVTAYLLPRNKKNFTWNVTDIIYDFLQVLLINYFAQRKSGIFTHAVGIKDLGGKGFIFAGKSGCGKSTTARIWHKHTKATVLNDDRIIIRKIKGKFFIYGSPWHGDFSDYLTSHRESAPLSRIFFLYHAAENKTKRIIPGEAFLRLYPAIFPTFWDAKFLKNTISLCQEIVNKAECLDLGFVRNKSMINFVRNIEAHLK
jgi:hypothetical protein